MPFDAVTSSTSRRPPQPTVASRQLAVCTLQASLQLVKGFVRQRWYRAACMHPKSRGETWQGADERIAQGMHVCGQGHSS